MAVLKTNKFDALYSPRHIASLRPWGSSKKLALSAAEESVRDREESGVRREGKGKRERMN